MQAGRSKPSLRSNSCEPQHPKQHFQDKKGPVKSVSFSLKERQPGAHYSSPQTCAGHGGARASAATSPYQSILQAAQGCAGSPIPVPVPFPGIRPVPAGKRLSNASPPAREARQDHDPLMAARRQLAVACASSPGGGGLVGQVVTVRSSSVPSSPTTYPQPLIYTNVSSEAPASGNALVGLLPAGSLTLHPPAALHMHPSPSQHCQPAGWPSRVSTSAASSPWGGTLSPVETTQGVQAQLQGQVGQHEQRSLPASQALRRQPAVLSMHTHIRREGDALNLCACRTAAQRELLWSKQVPEA